MGYTTYFSGYFRFNKKVHPLHKFYINRFLGIRHMQRNVDLLPTDPLLKLVGLPIGEEGKFYPGTKLSPAAEEIALIILSLRQKYSCWNKDLSILLLKEIMNLCCEDEKLLENYIEYSFDSHYECINETIVDYNQPPSDIPGLWCSWNISNGHNYDGDFDILDWDGGEKFYYYVDWLEFIIKYFLTPWGYVLNGSVLFEGEDRDDCGYIQIIDNIVTIEYDEREYSSSEEEN